MKQIVDYPDSNDGKVFSKKFNKNKQLKLQTDKNGYLLVNLYKNGNQLTHKVHRLVAKAFIDNPEDKPEVNHKNGIKTDNKAENL